MAVKPRLIRTNVQSLDEVRRSLEQINFVFQNQITTGGGISGPPGGDFVLRDGSLPLTDDWANRGRRIRETGVAEVRSDTPISPATGLFWLDTTSGGTVLKLFDSSAWISFALQNGEFHIPLVAVGTEVSF